jgi:hypothetical protein
MGHKRPICLIWVAIPESIKQLDRVDCVNRVDPEEISLLAICCSHPKHVSDAR